MKSLLPLVYACESIPDALPIFIELVGKIEDSKCRDNLIWQSILGGITDEGRNAFESACLFRIAALADLIRLGSQVENPNVRDRLFERMSEKLMDHNKKVILQEKTVITRIVDLRLDFEFPNFFSLLTTEAKRFLEADKKQVKTLIKDFERTLSIQQELRAIVDNHNLTPQEKIIAILVKYKDEGGLISRHTKTEKVKEILSNIDSYQSLNTLTRTINESLDTVEMRLGQHLYSYKQVIDCIAKQGMQNNPQSLLTQNFDRLGNESSHISAATNLHEQTPYTHKPKPQMP